MTLWKETERLIEAKQTVICPQPSVYEYINELIGQINKLTDEINRLREENKGLTDRLAEMEALAESLKGMLRRQVDDRFNKHSEKARYINPSAEAGDEEYQAEEGTASKLAPLEKDVPARPKERKQAPHGRAIPGNIPVIEQIIEIPEGDCNCGLCGKAYRRTTMYEESNEIDIQIKVVRNRIKRVKYAKDCDCDTSPEIVTAEKPANIIYKSLYSTSLWVLLLVFKYCYQIPLFRQSNKLWSKNGYVFRNSTIIGGFKKLHAVLVPLYNAMIKKSKTEEHWNADETSWKVFTDKLNKKTFNWWMWVFASANVIVYILDRTRSAAVPKKHLGEKKFGIINVDRYTAYKVLAPMLLLALCWYHVRRDFIKAAVSFPKLADWANSWIELIAGLEDTNDIRVESFVLENPDYPVNQSLLENKVDHFFERCQEQLSDPALTEAQAKVLRSLQKNKEGLTVFVSNPLVPMHNNLAERSLRPLALGRNNYYGSRAPWSGELAAICMSINMTAQLYNIDTQAYMKYYFQVCANNDSKPPDNIEPLLFWNLSDEVIDLHNLRSDMTTAP